MYGTDDGVYLSDLREPNQDPVKVLALLDVLQVDVLEDYQLLIVLSGQSFLPLQTDFCHYIIYRPAIFFLDCFLQNARSLCSLSMPWTHLIPWLA